MLITTAVFFIALLPQFVPSGAPVLPWTLAMALILICVDLVYFTALAWVVTRAKRAIVGSRRDFIPGLVQAESEFLVSGSVFGPTKDAGE